MTALNTSQWTPAPGDSITCGNRKDRIKADRRHNWLDAGTDIRHQGDGDFKLMKISICADCGRDKMGTPDGD